MSITKATLRFHTEIVSFVSGFLIWSLNFYCTNLIIPSNAHSHVKNMEIKWSFKINLHILFYFKYYYYNIFLKLLNFPL